MTLLVQPVTTWLRPAAKARSEMRTTCSEVMLNAGDTEPESNPARLEKSVAVGPGQTAKVRTPEPRNSSFSAKLQCSRKALEAP